MFYKANVKDTLLVYPEKYTNISLPQHLIYNPGINQVSNQDSRLLLKEDGSKVFGSTGSRLLNLKPEF